jgi:hypothetical protein
MSTQMTGSSVILALWIEAPVGYGSGRQMEAPAEALVNVASLDETEIAQVSEDVDCGVVSVQPEGWMMCCVRCCCV